MTSLSALGQQLDKNEFLFTSESVTEGHPDKLCDIISDSILDACMMQDPNCIAACEVVCKTNIIILLGAVTTTAKVNFEQVVREACRQIGYDDTRKGMDWEKCHVIVAMDIKPPVVPSEDDERKKVERKKINSEKTVFGYACNETDCKMPLTYYLATQLAHRLMTVRKLNILPWVGPYGKTQVTCVYKKDTDGSVTPVRVHTVIIFTQHSENVSNEQIATELKKHVVEPVLGKWYNDKITFRLSPSGSSSTVCPHGTAGLTGRKLIVDTYGGWGAHGGAAFSGKDPATGTRSVAYAARWIAKSLVCAGLCNRAQVQLSYSSAGPHPISVLVKSFGTSKSDDAVLTKLVINNFDLRTETICKELDLLKPIFSKTACYGHFGREGEGFAWEKPKILIVTEKMQLMTLGYIK